jgi:ABC-2 type transport system ATP-binding protein
MPVVDVRNLTKRYGEITGVESLSFGVESGEVFGFLGPNGAGKTTTIRTLMGALSPTEGTATVLGADVRDEAALVEARRRIGYLPATLGFDEDRLGERILEYHAALKGEERREELLEIFTPPLDRKVREYSSGNAQMLGLIQAFMHDPDLVVMDEPTSGLDPLKQERFNEFLRAERDRGTTVFFSSHVLSEVRRVCDRVGILRDGRLVALEDVEALLARGGKRVRVQFADPPAPSAFAGDGVVDVERVGEGLQFTYTGDYNALLDRLAAHDVVDVEIAEPPLEDVFMHFYGPEAEADGSSSTTGGLEGETGGTAGEIGGAEDWEGRDA